ncbi:MAG TPA: hypothetical protein VJ276_17110 [Thermoanaerobaculia bacterium]|nr:hypothetical protein [Thermoanaerobaculia bacterium]
MIWQLLSTSGAVLVLFAYAAHQTKRVQADTVTYQLLNFLGGTALAITAVVTGQLGFVLMEGSWAVISAWGLWKVLRGEHDITPLP